MAPSRGLPLLLLLSAFLLPVASHFEGCEEVQSCCLGTADGTGRSRQEWDAVKQWSHNYNVRNTLTSTPRELERYYTFYHLLQNFQLLLPTSESWLQDCYFGVATIFLNAVPAVEFEQGREVAQDLFQTAKQLILEKEDWILRSNWSIPIDPLHISYPRLLGLEKNDCYGSSLKVYVYDTGTYMSGALFCSAGQWGVEVLYHLFFAGSACRTNDPDEADFFLVPDYRACQYHLHPQESSSDGTTRKGGERWSEIIDNHAAKTRPYESADDIFVSLLQQLPHFDTRPEDHVFIFSDQGLIVNFTNVFPSWRQHIPRSIFLTTEAWTPGCHDGCFNPWKDIVIPGHIDTHRRDGIRAFNRPSSERNLIFNFHGRMPGNHHYYENVTVRAKLMDFENVPGVSVGGFVEDYFEIMGRSHFCVIPEGTSSWTNHLYEAFFAGCIPFILSDKFEVPYHDRLDWNSFSVKWPQDFVGETMLQYMSQLITTKQAHGMKQLVEDHACWFDFYSTNATCSPYLALIGQLEKRRKGTARVPKIWGPKIA